MMINYHNQFYMPSNPKLIKHNKDKGIIGTQNERTLNSPPAMGTPEFNYLSSNYLWEQPEG